MNAETRLIATVRRVIHRNNVATLNSICDKVLAELGVTKEQAYTGGDSNRTVRDRIIRAIMEYAKEAAGLSTADVINIGGEPVVHLRLHRYDAYCRCDGTANAD